MDRVTTWFKSLEQRERLLVAAVGALLIALFAYFTVFALNKTVNTRATMVERKQRDLAWMRSMAPTLRAMSSAQPGGSGESLFVIVDRTARQASLPNPVTTPNGDQGVRIRLEAASFDSLVVWLGTLQQQYAIGIESANFDSTGKSGVVNASLILTRSGQGAR